MAAGQISNYDTKPTYVYCGECQHFKRDTSGRSFHKETGEFFMGVCNLGRTPDTPIKQFADKPRQCDAYTNKTTALNQGGGLEK